MSARDGIDLNSPFDMPDLVVIAINELDKPSSRRTVDVDFGQDQIKFYHDDKVATVPSGGINLTDSSATGGIKIYFNLPVGFEDMSLVGDSNRPWYVSTRGHGTVKGDDVNGVPEIVGWPGVWFTSNKEPGYAIVPILEASLDFNNSVDKYLPTSPNGFKLVPAYESETTPNKIAAQTVRFTQSETAIKQITPNVEIETHTPVPIGSELLNALKKIPGFSIRKIPGFNITMTPIQLHKALMDHLNTLKEKNHNIGQTTVWKIILTYGSYGGPGWVAGKKGGSAPPLQEIYDAIAEAKKDGKDEFLNPIVPKNKLDWG